MSADLEEDSLADYRCGTCGSTSIILAEQAGNWLVTCGNGHEITPTPGTVLVVDEGELDAADMTWPIVTGHNNEYVKYEDRRPWWRRLFDRRSRRGVLTVATKDLPRGDVEVDVKNGVFLIDE